MPVTQPISGARVGDSTFAVGAHAVVNVRQGVFPPSMPSTLAFGTSTQVRDTEGYAETSLLLLDALDESYNFPFGGAQLLFTHAYAATDRWGALAVSNVAQDLRPTGCAPGRLSSAVVVDQEQYSSWTLVLADEVPVTFHFVLGGAQVLSAHGRASQVQWGATVLRSAFPIRPTGFTGYGSYQFGGIVIGAAERLATFNLDLVDSLDASYNFLFGGAQPLFSHAYATADRWGDTSVSNAAQDIRPMGFSPSPGIVSPVVYGQYGWINFELIQDYEHPHTANLGFYFVGGQEIGCPSIPPGAFGTPTTYLYMRPVYPTGVGSTAVFGGAVVDHFALKILPPGWVSDTFGSPTLPGAIKPYSWDSSGVPNGASVRNFFQTVVVFPFTGQPPGVPVPNVFNKLQFVSVPSGMFAGTGVAWVSNYYRWLYEAGAMHAVLGTPSVGLGRRYVGPAYLAGTQTSFGTPFIAAENRELALFGFDAGGFGAAEVRDKARRCYPAPRASKLIFGTPLVRFRTQWFATWPFDSSLHGVGVVYLRKQEVKPPGILQWEFERDRFGAFSDVFNKNKKITTNGQVDSRFSNINYVYNAARPLYPVGIPALLPGDTWVSHRIRSFTPEWYTQEVFGTAYVRTRKVISLDGWGLHSMRVGVPRRVWSNQQTLKPYATYPHTEYGRPWVSYYERELRPTGGLTQPAGYPFVSHSPRTLLPVGIPQGYLGLHRLETRFNLARAWGYLDDGYGTPVVYNNTPEVHPNSAVAFEPGRKPLVQLWVRYLRDPSTQDHAAVGYPYVAYRTRKIRAPSLVTIRWGNALVQFDYSAFAPPEQRILPESIQGGAGALMSEDWPDPMAPYSGQTIPFGYPVVRLNTVFVASLDWSIRFGEPTLRGMVIVVDPGPMSMAFGTTKLFGGTKWIRLASGVGTEIVSEPEVIGAQSIRCGEKWNAAASEWYAWSFHTSQQPGDPWYQWGPQTAGPVLGAFTAVTHRHRSVLARYPYSGEAMGQMGTPRVSPRPQRIRPTGTLTYKRGLHEVFHSGQLPVYVFSWPSQQFGGTHVVLQDYGTKWIRPSSIAREAPLFRMGVNRVELKNRPVYPEGINSFVSYLGASYVGPYLRIYLKPALDHSEFGWLYIDHRHRSVRQVEAEDGREPWQTSVATRVIHQARGYFIDGTRFEVQFGAANVGHDVRSSWPAGWEEFETGFSYVPDSYPGLSKLRAMAFITSPYTTTMEFGNGTVANV